MGHIYCSKDIDEKEEETFWMELENLMNEYEVYNVEARLNPFSEGVKIKR